MWTIIQNFLDTSGIHGLNYIHPRNSIISRIFGIICVVLGFTTAGFFLKGAFEDWDETPVITTLDSIAAPISMIQFPTVTICQDEYKPTDNWAFLETILNNVAFECSNEECKETLQLRKDFDDLIKSVVNVFRGWLMNNAYKTTTVYDVLVNRTWDDSSELKQSSIVSDFEHQILGLMENGMISQKEIYGLFATESFSTTNSIYSELKSLSKEIDSDYDYYSPVFTQPDPFDCNTTKCQNNAILLDKAIRFLYVVMNIKPKQQFGSFLASFAQISDEFLCFKKAGGLSISKPEIYHLQNILTSIDYDCGQIHAKKYKLHGYFEELSKIAGFSENELVSLYDLPAIVATLNMSKLFSPSFPQFFLHTRCRAISDWHPYEIRRIINDCSNSWNTFAMNPSENNLCGNTHNDTSSKMKDMCCNHKWTKRMGNNLKAIMKVMRIIIGRGKSRLNGKEFFQMSKPYLNYSLIKDEKYFSSYPFDIDFNSIIPWCEIKDEKEGPKNIYGGNDFNIESCDLFNPIVTDIGICHSFNTNSTMDMLKNSYFTEAFKEAFKLDLSVDKKLKMGIGSGSDHALNFYLMGNNFHRKLNDRTHWYVGISDNNNYFDMKSIGKLIKPGYQTIWKVQAMEIVPSEDLRDVPVDKRKCRFNDENEDLVIFERYSQTACEYECRIRKANTVCGCYPWYVPAMPKSTRHTICDVYGNFCFKEMLKKVYHDCLKNCIPNCHQIEFTYTQEQILRDPETVCNKYWKYDSGNSLENIIVEKVLQKGYYNSLVYKYAKISEWEKLYKSSDNTKALNVTIDPWNERKVQIELCTILVKDHMAKVSIMFDKKKYVRTLTTIKATFNDKLANFGGTLGLFTGMSILSIIEIGFWISKCFLYFLRPLAPREWNPA